MNPLFRNNLLLKVDLTLQKVHCRKSFVVLSEKKINIKMYTETSKYAYEFRKIICSTKPHLQHTEDTSRISSNLNVF